jgi:hypothetical protein
MNAHVYGDAKGKDIKVLFRFILPTPPPVELLHLLGGAGALDAVTLGGGVRGPPPGGGAVHMVHVEDTSVAVDARLPVCTHTGGTARGRGTQRGRCDCNTTPN